MGMRDDDCSDAAKIVDAADGLIVDVCDAIPEHVAGGCAAENGTLANGYLRHGVDADEAGVIFVHAELVVIFFGLLQLAECCP